MGEPRRARRSQTLVKRKQVLGSGTRYFSPLKETDPCADRN
jgi:hypothetical protein